MFKRGSIDSLDQETLFTIQKFFENNLNVSETSRKLFVHRNTLVYRLEKIKKLTGLDLREFDDAIVFKVALMVKNTSIPTPLNSKYRVIVHFVHKYGSFYVESAQKRRHILLNHTEYPKNSYKTVTKTENVLYY